MNYYNIMAMLKARKTEITIDSPIPSFRTWDESTRHYIQPVFRKVVFDIERPTILLVSAIGSAGKSTLAKQLSCDTGLPVFDLATHDAVGATSLTGLLASQFEPTRVSAALDGIRSGTFGVIIDGVDEGRSKVTESGFRAFLDDIVRLANSARETCIVMLGRSQSIEDCWAHLVDHMNSVAIVEISPFNLDTARSYIDAFSDCDLEHRSTYESVRDSILDSLSSAFGGRDSDAMEFLGYPPVLDAVATLLKTERNYYRLESALTGDHSAKEPVRLLYETASYILDRERDAKVIPNIIEPILADHPYIDSEGVRKRAYTPREQCLRLIAHCCDLTVTSPALFGVPVLDALYEERLAVFLLEHPFINGQRFRNAVFESLAAASALVTDDINDLGLATLYLDSIRPSHHLVPFLEIAGENGFIPAAAIGSILAAAMEFHTPRHEVSLTVTGGDPWSHDDDPIADEVLIEVDVARKGSIDQLTTHYEFRSRVDRQSTINVGSRLAMARILVPCNVCFGGAGSELELIAPIEVEAESITLNASGLVVRRHELATSQESSIADTDVILDSITLNSSVLRVNVSRGTNLLINLYGTGLHGHPIVDYLHRRQRVDGEANVHYKYIRMRRILMEFRSHKYGALRKLRDKIENDRVLKNELGRQLLKRLVDDRILTTDGRLYTLDPIKLDEHMKISWQDLRRGEISAQMLSYLSR